MGPSIFRALASVASTPAAASLAMMALLTSANVNALGLTSEAFEVVTVAAFEGLKLGALDDFDSAEPGRFGSLAAAFK